MKKNARSRLADRFIAWNIHNLCRCLVNPPHPFFWKFKSTICETPTIRESSMQLVQSFQEQGCVWSIHHFDTYGVRVYCLSGRRARKTKTNGPQDFMQKYSQEHALEMHVAFDHPSFNKVFGAVSDPYPLYYQLVQSASSPGAGYEIIRGGHPCRPYVDLEWPTGAFPGCTDEELLRAFVSLFIETFKELYPICAAYLDMSCVHIATATRPNKSSFHLVVNAINPLTSKPLLFQNPETHLRHFMEYFYFSCAERCVNAKVLEDEKDRKMFWRDDKSKQIKSIWDTRVYTPNRQFRFVGCSKLAQPDSVLLPCDLSLAKPYASFKDIPYEKWREYVVSALPCQEISLFPDIEGPAFLCRVQYPTSIKSAVYTSLNMHFSALHGEEVAARMIDQHVTLAMFAHKRPRESDPTPSPKPVLLAPSNVDETLRDSSTSFSSSSSSSSSADRLNEKMFSMFDQWQKKVQNRGSIM